MRLEESIVGQEGGPYFGTGGRRGSCLLSHHPLRLRLLDLGGWHLAHWHRLLVELLPHCQLAQAAMTHASGNQGAGVHGSGVHGSGIDGALLEHALAQIGACGCADQCLRAGVHLVGIVQACQA